MKNVRKTMVKSLIAAVTLIPILSGLAFGSELEDPETHGIQIKRARIECLIPNDCEIRSFSLPEPPSPVKSGKLFVRCANSAFHPGDPVYTGYLASIPPLPPRAGALIPLKIVLRKRNITVPECFVVLESNP